MMTAMAAWKRRMRDARAPIKLSAIKRPGSAMLRAYSGVVLVAFVICHLMNHAFGILSVAAMQAAHPYFMAVWRTDFGTILLIGAFFVHFLSALWIIYRRRTLRMPWMEAGQWITGLAIPCLLIHHAVGARGSEILLGIDPTYRLVVLSLWILDPVAGAMRAALIVISWTHLVLGLYLWLRTKVWFQAAIPALIPLVILVPTLSLSGYASAGVEIASELDRDHRIEDILGEARVDPRQAHRVKAVSDGVLYTMLALSIVPFAARFLRHGIAKHLKRTTVSLPDGRSLIVPPGGSVLEALRVSGIPHAAVCGGRGRCTTCRIRVKPPPEGAELPLPSQIEAKALSRIGAAEGVRLACQLHPQDSLSIVPLLQPTASARDGRRPGGIEGDERRVTALFIDLRRSTALGEEKLPFDVLFILNQFFAEMSIAIHETGGHYAQFNGDGLMALYGLGARSLSDEQQAARAAIKGAAAMLDRVQALNSSLKSELPFPLRVGIGLHTGDAIVGAMGPPQAQITSAIGDTINIAARLEALTKEHDVSVVMSATTAETAAITIPLNAAEHIPKGRETALTIHPVGDLTEILSAF